MFKFKVGQEITLKHGGDHESVDRFNMYHDFECHDMEAGDKFTIKAIDTLGNQVQIDYSHLVSPEYFDVDETYTWWIYTDAIRTAKRKVV